MADTKAIITATTPAGATVQKTITGINPDAHAAQLVSHGSALNAFTDNTYGKTEKVTKMHCDVEGGGKAVPTFYLTEFNQPSTITSATISVNTDTTFGIHYDGDATVFYSVEHDNPNNFGFTTETATSPTDSITFIGVSPNDNSYSGKNATIHFYAPETDNYQSASYELSLTVS